MEFSKTGVPEHFKRMKKMMMMLIETAVIIRRTATCHVSGVYDVPGTMLNTLYTFSHAILTKTV